MERRTLLAGLSGTGILGVSAAEAAMPKSRIAPPKQAKTGMRHRTYSGRVGYLDGKGGEMGREFFTVTVQPQPGLLWAARLAAPFLLFRLFDIWKPGPVDAAQGLPGGWGVVLDDVLAGILAALLAWPLDQWLGAQSLLHPGRWGG